MNPRDEGLNPGRFCEDRRDDIVVYVFGEMGPGAAEAFEAHVSSCAGCRREVESLRRTLEMVSEASLLPQEAPSSTNGAGLTWEAEWTLLRRRLLSSEDYAANVVPFPARRRALPWLARAAAVILTAGLAFGAGYLFRGGGASIGGGAAISPDREGPGGATPVAGVVSGNYFDSLDDFSRDTHNFLRRSRMLLMEFANLGADSDPSFFRQASPMYLAEVGRYREVARRMQAHKLVDLLDQIEGVLKAISEVTPSNASQVIREVKATLDITGLITAMEILDANIERDLRGQSHV